MYLYKEPTSNDLQLKSHMVFSGTDDQSKGSEKIWKDHGFFGDQRADLTILKANFPENCLVYVNQGQLSILKNGEKAMYLDFIILGQIMPAANADPSINFDTYECKSNEVIIYCPVYNKSTGLYGGLTKKLGYITLRGDLNERFFSYGYQKEKSSLFYSSMKTELPNVFCCTSFKKHLSFLVDQNQNGEKSSLLFFFLPSTLDRKEEFLQYKDHVHLHSIDLSIDYLKEISEFAEINPALLNNKSVRGGIVEGYYKVMKKIAEVSNQNLVRNADAYISGGGKIDPKNNFSWINNLYKESKQKFQLTY